MDTIKSNADISYLFTKGKRYNTPYLTLIVLPYSCDRSLSESGRVAFIAGKKNGNAVWRNTAKRRMRELCRSCGGPWKGVDVVFLAKKRLLSAPYGCVRFFCCNVLQCAGLEVS